MRTNALKSPLSLRIGELDFLAEVQNRERARFELADLRARVGLRRTVLVSDPAG